MKVKGHEISLYMFFAALFALSFEQALVRYLGLDTSFKPYRLALLLSFVMTCFSGWKLDRRSFLFVATFFGIYSWGIVLGLITSAVGAGDMSLTLHQAQLFFLGFLFCLVPLATIDHTTRLTQIWIVILISAVVSSVIALVDTNSYVYRFSGFFRNPNHYGYLVALSILVSLSVLQDLKSVSIKFLLIGWIALGGILLILCGSRGAFVAVLLASALLFYRKRNERSRDRKSRSSLQVFSAITLATGSTAAVINAGFIDLAILTRFEIEAVTGAAGRTDIWRAGLLAAADSNYLGIGIGQYIGVHSNYILQVGATLSDTVFKYDLGLHSEIVSIFVEFGVVVLLLYVVLLFVLWRALVAQRKICPELNRVSILCEAMLVLTFVFSLTQDVYTFPYYWLVIGMCISTCRMRKPSATEGLRLYPR